MKKIYLSGKKGKGMFCLVDDDNYYELSKWKWHLHTKGYAIRKELKNNKQIKIWMQREILKNQNGNVIDHINRNKLDNRKENLRICNHSLNHANSKNYINNTSGYRGVYKSKYKIKKWRACIKNKTIGYFISKEEAALAYNKWATKYYGEFSVLNLL